MSSRVIALYLTLLSTPLFASPEWVTAWNASPSEQADDAEHFSGRTVLQNVLITASGQGVRLRVANVDEREPYRIESLRFNGLPVLFRGKDYAAIPPDNFLLSDTLLTAVSAGEKLEVRLFLPAQKTQPTIHWYGREDALISVAGNFSDSPLFPVASKSDFRLVITAIDVLSPVETVGIVALGDSITDGSSAEVGTDGRWPDVAWRVLHAQGYKLAMANAGIGGDRLLRDARHTGTSPGVIERLNDQVLALAGINILIIAAGINDIAWPGAKMHGRQLAPDSERPTADELIAGYRAVIASAKSKGLTIIGATITPYAGGNTTFVNFYSKKKDRLRTEVNQWIRESGAFDAVIDFDTLLADPSHPRQLKTEYDSGDHIHPAPRGLEAMGQLAAAVLATVEPIASNGAE
ncbi:MAG: SGNH/GDSL hydrolase family protein [Pseudomonadota bacterium]